MGDWECFAAAVPWFLDVGRPVEVQAPTRWGRATIPELPVLSRALRSSAVTPVVVDGQPHELLAWGPPDARRGWLALPPRAAKVSDVHPVHRQFWDVCGGIVQYFGAPDTWWNNQDQVLTESVAQMPLEAVLADYSWLWENAGMEIPIDPHDYCAVAVEGNGNLTLAHRINGRLLLFAPDHAFAGVTPLTGCPPYSLMTIDAIPDLASWIETTVTHWM